MMKIALIYPTTCDPPAPCLSLPALTGYLRANGVEVLPIDANIPVSHLRRIKILWGKIHTGNSLTIEGKGTMLRSKQ